MNKIAAFKKNPEFSKLKAVKNGRVLVYSCDNICHANAAIEYSMSIIGMDYHNGQMSLRCAVGNISDRK